MTDLSLVPTEELWDALKARFEAAVLGIYSSRGATCMIRSYQSGNPIVCTGVAMDVVRHCQTLRDTHGVEPWVEDR